jgi:hypothetical protein
VEATGIFAGEASRVGHHLQYLNPSARSQGCRRPRVPAWPRTRGARTSSDWAVLRPDPSPETFAFRGLRAVRSSSEAPQLLLSSCTSASGMVNQGPLGREVSRCIERQSASTPATVGQCLGRATALAHRERPRRTQPLVAKRRRHAGKRERVISVWGREARSFTLTRSASRFRARPSALRGLRPLMGSRAGWAGFERLAGSRLQRGLDDPSWRTGIRVPDRLSSPNAASCGRRMQTDAERLSDTHDGL